MNLFNNIPYEYIIKHASDLYNRNSELFIATKAISDTISYSFIPHENKVFRFTNNYIIEQRFLELMEFKDANIIYNESNKYFHRGVGDNQPDIIVNYKDGSSQKIEIKSYRNISVRKFIAEKMYLKHNHNADFIAYFDRMNQKWFKVIVKTGEYKFICEDELYLPFQY